MKGSLCNKNKFCFQGNCVNGKFMFERVLLLIFVVTFVGNNWVHGRCAPTRNGIVKLGYFKYNEGMEDCLASCRIYGLTACEFDEDDGQCWAYTKYVAVEKGEPFTFCYKFKDKPFNHGS